MEEAQLDSPHTHWPHSGWPSWAKWASSSPRTRSPDGQILGTGGHGQLREGSRFAGHERGVHGVLTVMVTICKYFLPV